MRPIIIITDEERVTLPVEELKGYINDVYNCGFQDGYESGINKNNSSYTFTNIEPMISSTTQAIPVGWKVEKKI